ncbi:MAG: YaeQ family protein, partial [Gammaproteobacteria bacterium]
MALKATVFKAELAVSDMDRGYYQSHALTIARHPSETDERMMVRLLAFALNASEDLQFTRGLSTDDEPDLWQKNLQGDITLWIEVGLPDERRIRKACNRAEQVIIYAYGARTAPVWWNNIRDALTRFDNL